MMEVGLEVYRARFAGVQTDLGEQVTQGLELMKVSCLWEAVY